MFDTTTTVDGLTESANHGEYVSAMGGGKVAAQTCAGMPIKSNKASSTSPSRFGGAVRLRVV